jgi:hypothetical protein
MSYRSASCNRTERHGAVKRKSKKLIVVDINKLREHARAALPVVRSACTSDCRTYLAPVIELHQLLKGMHASDPVAFVRCVEEETIAALTEAASVLNRSKYRDVDRLRSFLGEVTGGVYGIVSQRGIDTIRRDRLTRFLEHLVA